MEVEQFVYVFTCTDEMTREKGLVIAEKSTLIFPELNLTGRVFSNFAVSLAITEGPRDIVRRYYDAVLEEPMIDSVMLQGQRIIEKREFDDYSVWLNIGIPLGDRPYMHELRQDNLAGAFPNGLSSRLRIMTDAYLTGEMLAPQLCPA